MEPYVRHVAVEHQKASNVGWSEPRYEWQIDRKESLIGGSAEFRILNPEIASTCSRALKNVRIAMSPFDNGPAPRCQTRQNSSCVFRCCAARTKEQEKPDPLMVVTELPTRLFPCRENGP